MTIKEKHAELILKWSELLDDLTKSEVKKYKYALAYERIVKNNNPKDYKVLLGIAHRIFAKDSALNIARNKNNLVIIEYDDSEFCINGNFIMDLVLPFVEAISDMIISECRKLNNFSHLVRKGNKIYLIY